jgi:HTH-type transcriptional regulator/antitoxin HigA
MSTTKTDAKPRRKKLPTSFLDLNRRLPLQTIKDDVGLDDAIDMIDRLVALPRRSKGQEEYLATLSLLIEKYEDEHYNTELASFTPLEMLQYLVEENGMTASDLGRVVGQRQLGSKLLKGERQLSKAHISALAEHFSVDPGLFLRRTTKISRESRQTP